MSTVHDAAGGDVGVLALARAWHERYLADPVMSHPFDHGGLHPQHVERLAAYWGEALGGPTTFTDALGDEATRRRGDEATRRRCCGCTRATARTAAWTVVRWSASTRH